ncbi:MAG: CRISPR-associated protein Cas4 [Clostridia bacterium]|nr:CRISPR-associated protein Cas4 [Clostridia bacterium]
MKYRDEDCLQLSGLQHFLFCRRQWALIHIENRWAESYRTIDGRIVHERAHDGALIEKRGNTIITRGVSVFSRSLGISGKCDVLEFHRSEEGVPIAGWEGRWLPFPVEYKRGEPKSLICDEAQLCGQAMCLEEMLCCEIKSGALFYGQPRRRTTVEFTSELRSEVKKALLEMHRLYANGHTPKVKPTKACNACSLKEQCLPTLMKPVSVKQYLEEHL